MENDFHEPMSCAIRGSRALLRMPSFAAVPSSWVWKGIHLPLKLASRTHICQTLGRRTTHMQNTWRHTWSVPKVRSSQWLDRRKLGTCYHSSKREVEHVRERERERERARTRAVSTNMDGLDSEAHGMSLRARSLLYQWAMAGAHSGGPDSAQHTLLTYIDWA